MRARTLLRIRIIAVNLDKYDVSDIKRKSWYFLFNVHFHLYYDVMMERAE